MGEVLSRDAWLAVKATPEKPIFWRKITPEFKWEAIHFELALKWCEGNLHGWVYFTTMSSTFIFEDEGDTVMFELWARHAGFELDSGRI